MTEQQDKDLLEVTTLLGELRAEKVIDESEYQTIYAALSPTAPPSVEAQESVDIAEEIRISNERGEKIEQLFAELSAANATNAAQAEQLALLENSGRVNRADETGGTVKRFGFDCTVVPPDILPATNGAYVHYHDYAKLYQQLSAAPAIKQQVAEDCVSVPKHWESNIWYAAQMLQSSESVIDKNEGKALEKLYRECFEAPTHPVSANQPDSGKVIEVLTGLQAEYLSCMTKENFGDEPYAEHKAQAIENAIHAIEQIFPSAPIAEGDE